MPARCEWCALMLLGSLLLCQAVAVPLHGSAAEEPIVGACWIRGERVREDVIQLRVAVKHNQSGLRMLENAVLAVSDPSSPRYGRHMSIEQVQALIAPPPSALQTVRDWLQSSVPAGVMQESSNGDFIFGLVEARTVELLLGVTLHRYHCATRGVTIVRPRNAPKLPSNVSKVVDFVTPGFRFLAVRRAHDVLKKMKQPAPTPTKEGVSPSMLRMLYNISTSGGKSSATQAVASFLHEYFSPSDLLAFQQRFSPASQGQTPKVVGSNVPSSPTLEASLDIQYLMSVAPGVATEFWYTSGTQPHNPGAEPFVEFLAAISETPDTNVPKVFSISYADDENQVELAYARRVSAELQKAAARGISMLVASGDFGVAGNTNQICHGRPFIPTFPAACPFITVVGGTWCQKPEIAFEISSGGFSNYFARPQYQDKAVGWFLKSARKAGKLPPPHRYNATGRAFPDISAQSANFPIRVKGADDAACKFRCPPPYVSYLCAIWVCWIACACICNSPAVPRTVSFPGAPASSN